MSQRRHYLDAKGVLKRDDFNQNCLPMLSFIAVVALLYQLSHVALLAPGVALLAIAYCLSVVFFFIHHVVALRGYFAMQQQRLYDFSS